MGKKHQSTVRSYQPADEQETHDGDDTLTATPILPPFAYPPPFDSHLWEENPYTLQEEVSKLLECNRTAFNTQPPTFVNLQHGPEDPAHTVRWSPSGQLIATVSAGTADRSGMVIIHDRTPNSSGALPVVSNFEAPQDAIRGKKCATRLHVMDWARPGDTYLVVGGVAVYDEISAFCRVFIVEAATGRLMWQYGGGMGCSEDAELTTEQHLSFNWNSSILCFALGAPRGLPGKVLVFNVDSSRFPTKGENPVTAKADKVWLLGDYDDVSRVRWGPKGDLQDRLAVAVITRKRTGKLYIMDASTGVISQVYDQHQTPIAQLYWFPSRQWTPTSPVISPERICSLDTEGQLHVLSSHTLYGSVILTPHAIDDSVKQGETQLIVTVIDSPIKIFCLAAYGLRILTGHADGTVRCFGSFSGVELSTFRAHVPKTPIGSLDWTTNDQYIASLSTADAEQNRLCIWPSSIFETPAFENRFVPDDTVKRSILRTAISPEGTHLACAQRGGWVSITKMESGRVRGRKEATGFYHVDTRSSQVGAWSGVVSVSILGR
uniref:Anaphase-promoting complex subunit 4 WD40 domain-containing protein n=1 Tax=Chromera velia CCMP2878 TaxID=1169474 RepID=A0A0G4GJ57_9ALVE|eukprot:Cvel_22100.t1-p1 / transcript=Cvel_22100.t1 / gene=Cvel_22100 / organism=Chromera_velia_CCMP2878 / gene_product=hypothetical protein / transcript_product=hypothetical protein / location=Cvel_scaffold2139:22698-26625(-) / protein_length=547 / sequence_SO=supercontig / SO=protein_coding / is_pseudo=false